MMEAQAYTLELVQQENGGYGQLRSSFDLGWKPGVPLVPLEIVQPRAKLK